MQTRPIDEFVNIITTRIAQDQKAELKSLCDANRQLVATVDKYDKKFKITTDDSLFSIEQSIQQQISARSKQYQQAKADHELRIGQITFAITTMHQKIAEVQRDGIENSVDHLTLFSELDQEIEEKQEEVRAELQEEGCCTKLRLFCCCQSSQKIGKTQKKIAAEHQEEEKLIAEEKSEKQQIKLHIQELSKKRDRYITLKGKYENNPVKEPDDKLDIEIKIIRRRIAEDLERQKLKLNTICSQTFSAVVKAYEAFSALFPIHADNPLDKVMTRIRCRDNENQTAFEMYQLMQTPTVRRLAMVL